MQLRIVSYNVRSLRDDAQAVAALIRCLDVDVALIQEAPRFLRWRSKLAGLAHDSGLVYVTGGRTAAAMAVLCSMEVKVLATRQILLPKRRWRHQRGIAAAVLELAGQRFGVASIHLGLDPAERVSHAARIEHELTGIDAELAWVVGGDINELPSGPAWTRMSIGRLDTWLNAERRLEELTYSALNPQRRIDAIMCDPRFVVQEAGVPHGTDLDELMRRGSDHRPVLAQLGL